MLLCAGELWVLWLVLRCPQRQIEERSQTTDSRIPAHCSAILEYSNSGTLGERRRRHQFTLQASRTSGRLKGGGHHHAEMERYKTIFQRRIWRSFLCCRGIVPAHPTVSTSTLGPSTLYMSCDSSIFLLSLGPTQSHASVEIPVL